MKVTIRIMQVKCCCILTTIETIDSQAKLSRLLWVVDFTVN